jgi:hypothetical protein
MNRLALRTASLAACGLSLACAAVATQAQTQTQGQGLVFTCVNAAGRTLTSDRLIGECMDREQRVLSRDGTVVRIVPPSLTAEERAAREERDRKLAAEKQAKAEAVRRDRLLMQRFPSEAEHTKARVDALEDTRAAMKLSETRMAELARERKPLLDEAEFYKDKPLPAQLRQKLDANDAALAAQRDAQANQKAELDRIAKRYDAELVHLKRLWAGAAPGSILVMADPAADAKATGKPLKPASTQTR